MIIKLLSNELTDNQKEMMYWDSEVTQGMLRQLENSIVSNNARLSLPQWAEIDPVIVKAFTFVMVQLGYGKVDITSKFAAFEFFTYKIGKEEMLEYRINSKLRKLLLRNNTELAPANLVKSNGDIKETGLVRHGFAKCATREFKFDIEQMQRYYPSIRLNLIKGMQKAKDLGKLKDPYFADEANFEEMAKFVLDYYMLDNSYTLEANISDSRGRSIYKALKRIGNPVSSKDFRALLRMEPAMIVNREDVDQMNDIYYFIAELIGSKATTEDGKILDGVAAYANHELPELDLDTEHGRKDLHELIWLERIYTALDKLLNGSLRSNVWDIPLEIDASMSIAQVVGALTNDERLLERTNVLGNTLSDPWYIKGVPRLAAKAVGTPTFYGSSQSAQSLLKSNGIAADKEEIKAIKKEFNEGGLAIMRMFKDALIKNYNVHTPTLPVRIWKDNFTVEVNKWKAAGSTIVVTEAWNGKAYKMAFTHKPTRVPDYKHMKLFWATCLIHNLDSQIVNKIANDSDEWMLTIHDAIIAAPGTCGRARKAYATTLKEVNKDRHSILKGFRESIGAVDLKADIAFMKLHKATKHAENIAFNATAMK